jgi:hypothetical protein
MYSLRRSFLAAAQPTAATRKRARVVTIGHRLHTNSPPAV